MVLSGLITGSLQVSVQREFLQNSFAIRDVTQLGYEIYSVNLGFNPLIIQQQIQNQFAQVYSGDIHVNVFQTQNTFTYPSDSLRASKYSVQVEIKSPVNNLSGQFPELSGAYYSGLDTGFWTNYGQYLLGFKESYDFATNQNGNREFNHQLGFSIQTGASGTNTVSGRKSYAQQIASGIFQNDSGTQFGLYTMLGEISGLTNPNIFRNYFSESYDLIKNTYSFSRKREELPINASGTVINLNNSLEMNQDGTINVSEKASTYGDISYTVAQTNLENYLSASFNRCSGIYVEFYDTGIILQDSQYKNAGLTNVGLLTLINTPVKIVRMYDARSLMANYDVTYTNNPNFSGDGTITSQNFSYNVDTYNRVEATHTFDYTVNRITNNAAYIATKINNTTGQSPTETALYYTNDLAGIASIYPNLNLIKSEISWPNIQTKASAKLYYSNSPIYFVTINGVLFNMLDYTIDNKVPNDIVQEFKIINTPSQQSVLSYAYQTEKGELGINIKASIGKQTTQFYPDGTGQFFDINETVGSQNLGQYLNALYMFGGQVFLNNFNVATTAFNWFISDSKYGFDSDGNMMASLNYCYTIKKRLAVNFP